MTQKEMSRILNVSVAAISLGLRDSPKIGAELREKIKRLANLSNYRPNPVARTLLNGKTFNIGIVFPSFQDSFYTQLSEAIQARLRKLGYLGIFLPARTYEEYCESVECLLSRKIDGIISKPVPMDGVMMVKKAGVPIVFWGERLKDLDFVYVDLFKGAGMAVDHLVKLGHERIGFIGRVSEDDDRFRGYRDRLAFHRLPLLESRISEGPNYCHTGYAGFEKILKSGPPPSAVLAHNDAAAIGAMNAAVENGLRIPEDLSIIGFDNIEEGKYTNPPLTTIDQPMEHISRSLVEKLLLKMEDKDSRTPQKVVLEPRLIVRKSCGMLKK